jgi:hypothetical protein
MVNTNSRTAAYLRHAGLKATDVAGEGPWVTMAEAEAEAARRGLTVNLPEPLPPLDAGMARAYVQRLKGMGAHTMRLSAGSKTPIESAWQNAPDLTEDEATAWLVKGENLGVNLLRSGDTGWAVLDAENGAATAILTAAGLIPTAVTANAQDRTTDKFGGCHVWMRLPADVDASTLKSTLQLKLDGGGLIDILVGTRYVVAPGTVLDQAPGYRYAFAATGAAMNPDVWIEAAPWLIDASAPSPGSPGIEPLLGVLLPRRRDKRPPREDADRVTMEIDEVPWETWLDGDPRVQILGADGSCGCPVFHWAGASTQRSGILHEGCEFGSGFHAFSGTLISILGREHGSRLQFAAFLRGQESDLASVAREVGITMGGGSRPVGLTAEAIARISGNSRTAPDLRIVPENGIPAPRTPTPTNTSTTTPVTSETGASPAATPTPAPAGPGMPRIGTAAGLPITDGASALEAAPATGHTFAEGAGDDEPIEIEEDTGESMFRRIDEIDASGFWEMVPILRRTAKAAYSHGVGPWGLLGAALPRIACTVPPHVRLVGASGKVLKKNGGTSLNLCTILTGPPEEGKSEVIKVSQDLVPLPHATPITTGTGEGIIKTFVITKKPEKAKSGLADEPAAPILPPAQPGSADGGSSVPPIGNASPPKNSGYETIHLTDTAIQTAGEISGMIAEMRRQGTKAMSVYRSAWMGEELGSTTGEVERRTYLAAHSYRFGAVLGSQIDVDALAPIFDEGKLGSPQRFLFLPVQTELAVGEPVLSLEIPAIDWYGGQAPAAAIGGLVAEHPPLYIGRPNAAQEEMEASRASRKPRRAKAYSVAEAERRAEDDDSVEDIKGHELLHQLKLATVLAIGDGLRQATDEYWHAARVIMEVRGITQETLIKVLNKQREVADRKRGRSQGRSQAEARRAEAQAKSDYLEEVATRINDIIRDNGAPTSEAHIYRQLGKAQKATAPEAIAALLHHELIYVFPERNSKGKTLYWVR